MQKRENPRRLCLSALAFLASSRPCSLSLSLSLSPRSLFPTPVSLFLTFLVPHRTLFLVLYVHCTNNSSSVSTETSLPALRASHSLFLSFLLSLCLRLRPYLSSLRPLLLTSFNFSPLINRASRYHFHRDQRPLLEYHLNVLIRARSESSFILSARGRKCREKSRPVRYSATVKVTVCSCSRCEDDKKLPPPPAFVISC